MMVAAHNYDLKAAQEVGFQTAFIRRPTEHGPDQRIDLEANRLLGHMRRVYYGPCYPTFLSLDRNPVPKRFH